MTTRLRIHGHMAILHVGAGPAKRDYVHKTTTWIGPFWIGQAYDLYSNEKVYFLRAHN